MPRPRKRSTLIPPGWRSALKGKFLNYAFRVARKALSELATKAQETKEDKTEDKITARQWAQNWKVADTWIEQWAEDTLANWRQHPEDLAGGYKVYPLPRDDRVTEGFSFTIQNAIPTPRLALGVSVGGKLLEGEPEDDWERFAMSLRKELEQALSIYHARALRSGVFEELTIRTDEELDQRLQVAALHVFGRKSAAEIGRLSAVSRDKSVVTRWLQEILKLLELPRTRRGVKSGSKGARNPH